MSVNAHHTQNASLLHTMLLTSEHAYKSLQYTDAVTQDVQVSSRLLPQEAMLTWIWRDLPSLSRQCKEEPETRVM